MSGSSSTRHLVGCDLDRTLVYSARALGLRVPDEDAPRLLVVEVHQGEPLSYMTEAAARLLATLIAVTDFVPATTRTVAQYRRIHLPGPVPDWTPRHAICANGGHLLVDGEPDQDWHAQIRATLAQQCTPLDEIVHRLALTADPEWTRKRRVAEDLFAYLVVDRPSLPPGWVEELSGWAAERGWGVSLQGRKVYLVPQPLTKSAALAEVGRRTGAATVLAAGDSLLDAELLLAADAAFRPGHGELAEAGWTAPGVTALAETGVAAGEELLRRMLAVVRAGLGLGSGPGPGPGSDSGVSGAVRRAAAG
ncbi:HAD family hydrolase [Streptacidiphilus sp. MAP5-3]|uniref:HAD family hydrolase n=1 Tax=unclassified Streptacidiphilus TaxID=2643834 RepID=UPI003519B402